MARKPPRKKTTKIKIAETASSDLHYTSPNYKKLSKAINKAIEADSKPKKNNKIEIEIDLYKGHRNRLRERFKETKGVGFSDYEFLELLLFRAIPRADTKPLAKALIARFGSLAGVLGADPKLLSEIKGCGPAIILELKIIKHAHERMNLHAFDKRNVFSSWNQVLSYYKALLASETKEHVRVMFLDKKNGLIMEEHQHSGTVDQAALYPREVMKRALELAASSIILIHNHPSGDPTPSNEDIELTKKLQAIGRELDINVHDHIIIGRYGFVSMKDIGVL